MSTLAQRRAARIDRENDVIKEKNLLTVNRGFERPDSDLISALTGAMTGHVVDCMGGRGGLDYRVKPLDPSKAQFCGVALTVQVSPGDNAALHGALDAARPGDVVVCASDGFLETAVVGDLLAGMMKNKGVVGFVTDGLARDAAGLRAVGLPVFTLGVTPNSPTGTGTGSVGLPIVCGGVSVTSGDIVIADGDGVVTVPLAIAGAVINELKEVRELERGMEEKVAAGATSFGRFEAMVAAGTVLEL